MAQRDYEEQPEAPDLGASVQLEPDYTLTGRGDTDPLDAGYVAPDRPYMLDGNEVTGEEMRAGDTLDERLSRERPDLDADTPSPEADRAGRLESVEDGPDTWPDRSLDAVDTGIGGGAASSEEAAVHVLPAEEIGEAPPELADDLDDPDLLDDALGIDDRAPEDVEPGPEEDVRVGRTATGDDPAGEVDEDLRR